MFALLVTCASLVGPLGAPARAAVPARVAMSPVALLGLREKAATKSAPARKTLLRPLNFVAQKVNGWRLRSWRKAAAIQDALLTAKFLRDDLILTLRKRDLAEASWEDRLLPEVSMTATRRNLAEVGWEASLLPAMALRGARRDLAEGGWEDRILPAPAHARQESHESLTHWERLLPDPPAAPAVGGVHTKGALDTWERLLD